MNRNKYALEAVIAWVEGLSVVAGIGFLFYNWQISVIALAVFIVCLPLRNFVKYGAFFPGAHMAKARPPIVSPLQREMTESRSQSVGAEMGKTI